MDDNALKLASDHAAQAEQLVSKQKAIIERLKADGKDTLEAEQTLALFEVNLKIFQEHRDSLLRMRRSD
jgi:Spy/CpxP family protein refolding chaperone